MSRHCPYCGKEIESTERNDLKEGDGEPWWCFASFCGGKQDALPQPNEVALGSGLNDANGVYKRRQTMPILTEMTSEQPERKTPYKRHSSVIRAKRCVSEGDLPILENVLPIPKESEKYIPFSEDPSQARLPDSFIDLAKALDRTMAEDRKFSTKMRLRKTTNVPRVDKSTSISGENIKLVPHRKKSKRTSPMRDAVKQPSETGSMQKQVFGDDKSETKMLVMPREKRHMSIYMSVSEPKLVDREASFTESEKKGRESIVKMKRLLPGSISSGQSLRRGLNETNYGFLTLPNRTPLKILLIFLNLDSVAETLSRAAERLGFDISYCSSYEAALEDYQSKFHDLVLIDTRSTKSLDYETLCRSIRNVKNNVHTVMVAIVKKNAFEKDDVTISALLETGFNKCLAETTNPTACYNELVQLKDSDVRRMGQYATNQALYGALDKSKDIVVITDDSYHIQYANRASEHKLGFRHDEIIGKHFCDQIAQDGSQVTSVTRALARGKEWRGQFYVQRKSQDPVIATSRAFSITCAGRFPTHYTFIMDISGATDSVSALPRGSIHSLQRPSVDIRSIGSDTFRRTSLAKLSALPIEAPITKIATLIIQAQDAAQNPEVVQILDTVADILKSTELYSVHTNHKFKSDEAVASDLIGALLSQQQPQKISSSRRSSTETMVNRNKMGMAVSKLKVPPQLVLILESSLSWEFDIFRLEDLCSKRPLQHLGMNLFLNFNVPHLLNCDEKILYNWLTVIELNYRVENTYHNSTHAADVMQAIAVFLEKERMKSVMEPLDEATCLIAAAAHDVDHPGRSSAFLSNSDNPLAILYNDVTVLEMHHASLTFKLTLGDDRINIFKNLDREMYKVARHNVIDMILATEMTKHFEHLAKFVNVFCTQSASPDIESEMGSEIIIPLALPENRTLVKRMMIKCADVSNPTRPLRLCVEWARRIAEEYFQQTDEEKNKGLPVVMPMFDRESCSIPKSQIGFVDYIINDMFEAWNAFIDMPELISYMRQNYLRWKELDEQGHTTLADIRRLQMSSISLCPMFPTKASISQNKGP